MKSSFHTKQWAVALVLALALGVQAAGASPVDAALDRDQEFLDSLADLADRMERGQLNGEWFFHEMDRLYVRFAPDFVPVDLDSVTQQQKKRSRSLKNGRRSWKSSSTSWASPRTRRQAGSPSPIRF